MAAIVPLTGLVAQGDLVPSEIIDQVLQRFNLPPLTFRAIGWFRKGQGAVPVDFPRWDELNASGTPGVPAGEKAESDEFTRVNQTTSKETITPGIPGFTVFISDELQGSVKTKDVTMENIMKFRRDMENRLDKDFHLTGATLTNDSGGIDTDPANAAWMRARFADFRALETLSPGGVAFVLHQAAWTELEKSLMATTAPLPVKGLEAEMFGPATGFVGSIQGFRFFVTNNVATSGAGKANYLTSIGRGECGLGGVVNEEIFVESVRGVDGATRRGTHHAISAWYGMGETAPQNAVRCLSAA